MSLNDFVGQARIKEQLKIIIHEGRMTRKLPHLGIFARAGMGKTFLSQLIAKELEAELIYLNSTAITDPIAFLTEINKARKAPSRQFIIFLDEAHMLPKKIQENMLSVLEEPAALCFASPSKKVYPTESGGTKTFNKGDTIKAILPKNISFVLGTTHRGHLRDTILGRLIEITIDNYDEADIIKIIRRNTELDIPVNVIKALTKVGKNIREIKKRLNTFAAYIDINGVETITMDHFKKFCDIYGIEEDGCTQNDLLYMDILIEHGTVGLQTMTAMTGVSEEEILNLIEPFLLQKRYLKITARGRELSEKGKARMGFTPSPDAMIVED